MTHIPPSPLPPHVNSLEGVDPDERLVAIIRRHPFGIFLLYLIIGVGAAAAILLAVLLLPGFSAEIDSQTSWWFKLIGFGVAVFLALVLVIATIIYFQSRLIITNKNITQVIQDGLFNRRVSQLAIVDIEDVTATRLGFFATALNFGLLLIETAGEQENFHFRYCPRPDYYAKLILEEREFYQKANSGSE